MRIFILSIIAGCLMITGAEAALISILVGDNDGFGAGIADNGGGSVITNFLNGDVVDYRSVAEANATDGAHATDFYYLYFPSTAVPLSPFNPFLVGDPSDPRLSTTANILFSFTGQLTSASLTIDFLDWQTDGYITATVNELPLVLGPAGNFSETFVRTYTLTPGQIAAANVAQQVNLTLGLNTVFTPDGPLGDLVAFDFFRLDGELADDPGQPLPVPLPSSWLLILSGLGSLVLVCRRRRASYPT